MKTDRLSATGKYLTITAIIDGDDCHHGCDNVDDDNYQNDEGTDDYCQHQRGRPPSRSSSVPYSMWPGQCPVSAHFRTTNNQISDNNQ